MPYFVVHEHHSRKLHYDFRLEINGVLKSWAVPKGPSISPKDKRLAIMVDDHNLEYGRFEGIIPAGHYGAGPVLMWDAGEYEHISGKLKNGRFEFLIKGKKLKGIFTLIRLKGKEKEWLLIKKQDEYSQNTYIAQPELTMEKLKKLKKRIPPCEA